MNACTRIGKIRELRELRSQLAREEDELARPYFTDLSMIRKIRDIYLAYLEDNRLPDGSEQKDWLIFVVLYLFSPSSLAGGRTQNGVRRTLAQILCCSKEVISHHTQAVMFQYKHYTDFADAVGEILRRVSEAYPINETNHARGGYGRGYRIMLSDGRVKNVEEIQVGDVLMSQNGESLVVTDNWCGRGRMVRIRPVEGESFYVSERQLLQLYDMKLRRTVEINAYSYSHQEAVHRKHLMLMLSDGRLMRFNSVRQRRSDEFYGFSTDGKHRCVDAQGFILLNS